MVEVLCAGEGSGAFASGAGSGLDLERRAASWKAGSLGASSASRTGLVATTSIAAARVAALILDTASCGRKDSAEKPKTAAIDSLVDTESTDLDRSLNIPAACVMLYLRTPNACRFR